MRRPEAYYAAGDALRELWRFVRALIDFVSALFPAPGARGARLT